MHSCSSKSAGAREEAGKQGVPFLEEEQAADGMETDLQLTEMDVDEDIRMATMPVSVSQEQRPTMGEGEGSSGGSENGSPAEEDEEDDADVEEDASGDEEIDSARRL